MQYSLVRLKNIYSKGIIDRVVGKTFCIYKPYSTYVHYRFLRHVNKTFVDVYYKDGKLGVAMIVSVKKLHKNNINDGFILIPKDDLCRLLKINTYATEIIFRWCKIGTR